MLPAAVLLGVMLTFGLMSRSHETMAIRTSGLNILSLVRPILIYSGAVALLLLALNCYLIPWSQGRLDLFWQTQVDKKPPRNLHNLEHFWYKGDQAIYNIVMFRKDIQTLEGVKIYLFDQQFHLVQIIAAARAQWHEDRWRFSEGYVQFFEPGTGAVTGEKFQQRDLVLTEHPKDFADLEKKVTEMDSASMAGRCSAPRAASSAAMIHSAPTCGAWSEAFQAKPAQQRAMADSTKPINRRRSK